MVVFAEVSNHSIMIVTSQLPPPAALDAVAVEYNVVRVLVVPTWNPVIEFLFALLLPPIVALLLLPGVCLIPLE